MLVLVLFIVAVAFVYVELFLPGGVFGIIGAVAFIASIVLAFQKYGATWGLGISVVELLPPAVGVSGDGTAFSVTIDPANFGQTLGDLCPICPSGSFPKVAFQTAFSELTTLPVDVIGATVTLERYLIDSARVSSKTGRGLSGAPN